jgi:hypothetical protein
MRRVFAITLGAAMVLGPASAASATHTGCMHTNDKPHESVPHRDNHGTHTAHEKIPYCPPQDAPGRR